MEEGMINSDDSLENEFELIVSQRENRAVGDPPTVSMVGSLYRNPNLDQMDNSYGVSINEILPPPLLSKEDWPVGQRFQVGGSSCEGIGDWWKKKNVGSDVGYSSSLFSMQPGLGIQKDAESEPVEMRRARNNSAEWEGLAQPKSSSNRIFALQARMHLYQILIPRVQLMNTKHHHVRILFTPVVGSSVSSPGLPPRLSFHHRLSDDSREDNVGPVNFHRRVASSADLNSNQNMFDFSNLKGPRNQVNTFSGMDLSRPIGRIPPRYTVANNHLASASTINTAEKGPFLRSCNFPPPVMDSQHGSYIVSHGQEDMRVLHKVYQEALLAQHNQQYGSPHFGRSGSLYHIYGNPTYGHGMRYHENMVEKYRPLSQQERRIQFAPALKNSVDEISFDRRYVSSLLDELKNNKSFELSNVVDHVTEFSLAQDQYGNYVVQHVLQHGKPHERSSIISKLSGQIVKMSLQKFSSNVVEKCLTYGSPSERQLLVKEMLGSTDENEPLQAMMEDHFGNYVVQKVLETCENQNREFFLSRIKIRLAALKRYTFGKHIVSRVEKLITSGERHVASSTSSRS
ncbi:hypothetical protein SSX86_031927 [Deinandra increscens subsp. villosa]|uniref:PUM-HD domain-containing protein n=1 Tax=Deinandra increscens subsp. villosa TaxID=3103831 RepID=A0AAP0GHS4_9ASTR